jgi:hypothetical protein
MSLKHEIRERISDAGEDVPSLDLRLAEEGAIRLVDLALQKLGTASRASAGSAGSREVERRLFLQILGGDQKVVIIRRSEGSLGAVGEEELDLIGGHGTNIAVDGWVGVHGTGVGECLMMEKPSSRRSSSR